MNSQKHSATFNNIVDLFKYIEIFEKLRDGSGAWHGGAQSDGTIHMPYVEYENEIIEFTKLFLASKFVDFDYSDTMSKYGWWDETVMIKDLPSMTIENALANLTAIFRQERFSDGTIQHFIENGVIIELLNRIKALVNVKLNN